jgi:hypothetical protein
VATATSTVFFGVSVGVFVGTAVFVYVLDGSSRVLVAVAVLVGVDVLAGVVGVHVFVGVGYLFAPAASRSRSQSEVGVLVGVCVGMFARSVGGRVCRNVCGCARRSIRWRVGVGVFVGGHLDA